MISLIIEDVVLYDITIRSEKCLAEMLISIFIYLASFCLSKIFCRFSFCSSFNTSSPSRIDLVSPVPLNAPNILLKKKIIRYLPLEFRAPNLLFKKILSLVILRFSSNVKSKHFRVME